MRNKDKIQETVPEVQFAFKIKVMCNSDCSVHGFLNMNALGTPQSP